MDKSLPGSHNLTVTRATAKLLGQYALGLGLLTWVVARNWRPGSGEPGLADTFERPFHLANFGLAVLGATAAAVMSFSRWYLLVRALDLPFRYRDALRLGLAGYFYNTFLPGSIGGDFFKAYRIAKEQDRRTAAVATVLIDRAIGLWGLLGLLALCGLIFRLTANPLLLDNAGLMLIVRGTWVAVGISIGVWLGLGFLPDWRAVRCAGRMERIPKVGRTVAELWRAVWTYRKRPRAVAVALGMSLVNHTINVLSFYYAARAFVDVSEAAVLPGLVESFLIVPVGMTVQAFVPTPGGLGGGEFSFGALFTLLGKPKALGIRASLVLLVVQWCIGLVGYFSYARMTKGDVGRPPDEPARDETTI